MAKNYLHTDHLTADQIQAYTTGELSDAEAHAVESHALQCTFCAEALQGVAESPERHGFADDVEILKTRIENEAQSNKSSANFPFRQLAAAVIVLVILVGGGYGIFQLAQTSSQDQLAETLKTEKAEPKEKEDSQVMVVEDTVTTAVEDTVAKQPDTTTELETTQLASVEKPEDDKSVLAEAQKIQGTSSSVEESLDEMSEVQEDQSLVMEEMEEPPQEEDLKTFKGLVKTASGEPLPFAVVAIRGADQGVSTDMDGNFQFNTTQDTVELLISSVGMEKAEVTLTPQKSEVEVVLQESALALEEVEISNTKSQNQLLNTSSSITGEEKETEVYDAQPIGGRQAFEVYIKENLEKPRRAERKEISGNVVLTFVVSEGKPTEIRVERSLGYGCDEEAMRLLKEGPEWKGERGRIEIKFE